MLRDGRVKMVQGVREIFEVIDLEDGEGSELQKEGKLVIIGRYLGPEKFEKSFLAALD